MWDGEPWAILTAGEAVKVMSGFLSYKDYLKDGAMEREKE